MFGPSVFVFGPSVFGPSVVGYAGVLEFQLSFERENPDPCRHGFWDNHFSLVEREREGLSMCNLDCPLECSLPVVPL